MVRDSKTMKRDAKAYRAEMKALADSCQAMLDEIDLKSKTDINNFKDPYYSVLLEDGPSHCFGDVGTYGSGTSRLYFSPSSISAFYKVLPFIVRYYKVTIFLVENPNPLSF